MATFASILGCAFIAVGLLGSMTTLWKDAK
jgi:hypothetical protein